MATILHVFLPGGENIYAKGLLVLYEDWSIELDPSWHLYMYIYPRFVLCA